MTKIYRKTAAIKAEHFDGTKQNADQLGLFKYRGGWYLETLEGSMLVSNGYWIATGVNGEHWAIADDIFKKTYAELPVIPKVVADYMKECRNIINLDAHSALYEAFDELFGASQDVNYWIEHNSDVFARAWLDGYTVEEDK